MSSARRDREPQRSEHVSASAYNRGADFRLTSTRQISLARLCWCGAPALQFAVMVRVPAVEMNVLTLAL